jgi:hypothetical protein
VVGSSVAEFPSPHGGTFLGLLADHGLRQVEAREADTAADRRTDVVVDACFGLMHAADQFGALRERVARLRPGGRLVLQYHSLAAILRHGQWNALRHGHYAYYSTPVLHGMLGRLGLTSVAARRFPLYGGTVCLVATRTGDGVIVPSGSDVASVVDDELTAGVTRPEVLRGLADDAAQAATRLRAYLAEQRALGLRVVGYGAASRAVALLNLAGVDERLLAAIADASPTKWNRRMPGTRIPVITPSQLVERAPDVVLVLVPELLAEARVSLPGVELAGGRWVDADRVGRPGTNRTAARAARSPETGVLR